MTRRHVAPLSWWVYHAGAAVYRAANAREARALANEFEAAMRACGVAGPMTYSFGRAPVARACQRTKAPRV